MSAGGGVVVTTPRRWWQVSARWQRCMRLARVTMKPSACPHGSFLVRPRHDGRAAPYPVSSLGGVPRRLPERSGAGMTHEEAFLADILADRADDMARRIYADWLMDSYDPVAQARGEFIHLHCDLARLTPGDPRPAAPH